MILLPLWTFSVHPSCLETISYAIKDLNGVTAPSSFYIGTGFVKLLTSSPSDIFFYFLVLEGTFGNYKKETVAFKVNVFSSHPNNPPYFISQIQN